MAHPRDNNQLTDASLRRRDSDALLLFLYTIRHGHRIFVREKILKVIHFKSLTRPPPLPPLQEAKGVILCIILKKFVKMSYAQDGHCRSKKSCRFLNSARCRMDKTSWTYSIIPLAAEKSLDINFLRWFSVVYPAEEPGWYCFGNSVQLTSVGVK